MMTTETKTAVREAFGDLQRNAETLRTQCEPNIDDLLSIVQGSVAAYKVCSERIGAVEAALREVLEAANSPQEQPAARSELASPVASQLKKVAPAESRG